MSNYERGYADVFLCPKLPQANFNNTLVGVIQKLAQKDVLPLSLIADDFPVIKPQRQDEESYPIGSGRNPATVLEKQMTVGAGTIPEKTIFGLMIPRIGGNVTFTETAKEIWTIVAVAKASITTGTYVEFDVVAAGGVITKYQGWFDKNGDGATDKPANSTGYKALRTMFDMDISAAVTAQQVADVITAAITALADVAAADGGGTTTTVTVTNDQNGAVDDAHDYNSGLVVATTQQGRTKVEIEFTADDFENQNFGIHVQRLLATYDRILDLYGITIATYEMKCEDGGVAEEDVNLMVSSYILGDSLSKPRGPDGVVWVKGINPFSNFKKNYGWQSFNENFTLTYGAAILRIIKGFSVKIENEMKHNHDGGGIFASGVDVGKRSIDVGLNTITKDNILFVLADTHINDYAAALVCQIKSIRGADTNDYVQWDFSSLRVLPIDEKIASADEWMERYDIVVKPAPNCVSKATIEGYMSAEYFGD